MLLVLESSTVFCKSMGHFLQALLGMLLKPHKHSAFLFRSYQVALGIYGTERYRWLEEILEKNHVYQILPVLYMKKPLWSMTLFFQRVMYWSVFRPPEIKTRKKKRNIEVLPKKGVSGKILSL